MEKYLYAIDSSLSRSGVAIMKKNGELVFYTSIPTSPSESIQKRLKVIGSTLLKLKKKYPCYEMCIEEGFVRFHTATKMLFRVRGVIEYIFSDCEIYSYSPRTVKKIITGTAKSEKEVLAKEIIKLFPKFKFENNFDITDAISVGVSHLRVQSGEYKND